MIEGHDGELNSCDQCKAELVGFDWTAVYGVCDECGQFHIVALVHTHRCLIDFVRGDSVMKTQMRRAGMARLN